MSKHALCAGDWERASTIDEEVGVSWMTPHALLDLGHLWLITGRQEEGVNQLERAIALA